MSSEQYSVGFELMTCPSSEVTLLNCCLTFKEEFKLISDKLISSCLLQWPEVTDSISFPYTSTFEKWIFIYLSLVWLLPHYGFQLLLGNFCTLFNTISTLKSGTNVTLQCPCHRKCSLQFLNRESKGKVSQSMNSSVHWLNFFCWR